MTSPQFAITVFTATFNRAHTIERVYRSLRTQTFRDFEWLVVDDGSTDETGALVRRWAAEADFPIHYVWQENRGKHRAYNRAVGLARGQLFLDFDSDDACVPRALERFQHHWEAIPAPERSRFSTVAALCVDDRGEIMGTKFSTPITDMAVCDADPRLAKHASPRQVAGGSIRENILKCQLKPLNTADYAPVTFTGTQLARLMAVFDSGVCDWSKPGVGQQEAISPLTFVAGPGGQPLPPAPVSVGPTF